MGWLLWWLQVLNVLPLPYSVATLQLGVGSLYVILGWL